MHKQPPALARAPGRAAQPPPCSIPREPGSGGLLWKKGKSMAPPERFWQASSSSSAAVNPSSSSRCWGCIFLGGRVGGSAAPLLLCREPEVRGMLSSQKTPQKKKVRLASHLHHPNQCKALLSIPSFQSTPLPERKIQAGGKSEENLSFRPEFLPSQGQLWTLPPSAANSSRQEAAWGGFGGTAGPSLRPPGCAGGGRTARSPPGRGCRHRGPKGEILASGRKGKAEKKKKSQNPPPKKPLRGINEPPKPGLPLPSD